MTIYRRTSVDAALYILRDIGRDMTKTQRQVSTGLRVERASDNGAYWAIGSTLKTDQKAQSAIRDALGLAAATMDTAYNAVDNAIDLVDKDKINTDIAYLKDHCARLPSPRSSTATTGLLSTDPQIRPSRGRYRLPSSVIPMAR
ncbi:hypothetical protein WGT02_14260 [Rhizobium sp. T1470]|uniref:flagellin N-terminal helical domain-containing protein n=1 Tax=Rhizobium sp. T1473 TaxID=555321 RepID=UPI001CD77934|nr:hypothetical protein [Rhizobium sp. T1473]MCA0802375.1 hypothetical protein [Rhizobium sp. T1473]